MERYQSKPCSKEAGLSAASHKNNVLIQPKLTVGAVDDPLEQEADTVADTVMRMAEPNFISRKCAHCEEEEAQRKPLASFIQRKETANSNTTSDATHNRIQATRGGGSVLPANTKTFMENRFGADFSHVRIHSGSYSSELSSELNAQAFTVGRDIYFNEGKFSPESSEGKRLLAHELTHTLQQGSQDEKQVNRKLSVTNPAAKIPNPSGKGKVQTNSDTALDYLNMLCPSGSVNISPTGDVSIPSSFCNATSVSFPFIGKVTTPPLASKSATPTGCGCICELVTSPNSWRITIDDANWPHTDFDDATKATTPGSGGTGGVVTAPSPNSEHLWGAVTKAGSFLDIDPWLVLGHELCGHAWEGNRGEGGKDIVAARGKGGHQDTVGRENLIRGEHGIVSRGSFRDAFCGESYFTPLATTPSAKTAQFGPSYMSACEGWRKDYNKLNGTTFTKADAVPVKAGEKLPP